VLTEVVNHFEPAAETFVVDGFVVAAGVVQQDIQRVLGQEKLMSSVVNLLPTKVPDVEPEVLAAGHWKVMAVDVNAFGGVFLWGQRLVGLVESPDQAGFAGAALADHQELGFAEGVGALLVALAKVVEDGGVALSGDFGWGVDEGAVLDFDNVADISHP